MQNKKQSILHFFFSERVRWTSSEPALTHTCSPEHGAVPLQLAPRDTVDSGVECSETASSGRDGHVCPAQTFPAE